MSTSGVLERLNAAQELPEILDAAASAFAAILQAIHGYHDGGGPFHAALVMAAVPAADGRDAIVSAPSVTPEAAVHAFELTGDPRWSHGDIATQVAELATAAEFRLLYAASIATDRLDAAASREGAADARQVRELLAGDR
jgi:hypothetical protein